MLRVVWNSKCRSVRRLDGKTAIITGSNTGIGKETARDFAKRGARVILACRNLQKAEKAKHEIIRTTGNDNIVVKKIDTSSMTSVREFARDIVGSERRLDILVNNAGLTGLERRITDEGIEYTMASNHFGGFLLTNLLLGLLKESAPSRIVNVSSLMHNFGKIGPSDVDITSESPLDGKGSPYATSKLTNILIAKELHKRLEGTGVLVNAVNPGSVMSDIWRNLSSPELAFVRVVGALFFKTCKEGAQTTIHCAVSEEMDGISGRYFQECKESAPSKQARDPVLAKKIWEISEALVKLQPSEMYF